MKYEYHYFLDKNELSKEEFIMELRKRFLKLDKNCDNPLEKKYYVDEKKVIYWFRKLERNANELTLFTLNGCFNIQRKEIEKDAEVSSYISKQ